MAYRPVRADFSPPTHELADFSRDPGSKVWVSEMSTLSWGGTKKVFGPIWKDSLDTGLAIKSPKTGRVEAFLITDADVKDGDIRSWTLRPMRQNLDMTIEIFNT